MKKLLTAFIISIISLSFTGCNYATAAENTEGDKTVKGSNSDEKGAIHITKEEFLEKIYNYEENSETWKYEGDKPAIVDFYADWCGPCKTAGPILEDLAKEYDGKIYVYKVNTDEERELAAAFGISSIPTFLLIPMGDNPSKFSGIAQTEEATREMFKQAIDEVLLKTQN